MRCSFCGVEVDDNLKICPACGKNMKKDKFPVWAIVLIVISGCGCFSLPLIGVIAAITIPSLVVNTESAKNKAVLKKTYSTFQQAYLMEYAINDRYYSDVDEVWEKSIKSRMNYTDIDDGIKLADGTEIKLEKLKTRCDIAPTDSTKYGGKTACAKLIIDTNGFAKTPNRMSTTKDYKKRQTDQFELWMYSDKVVSTNGSIENAILYNKLK